MKCKKDYSNAPSFHIKTKLRKYKVSFTSKIHDMLNLNDIFNIIDILTDFH